MEYEYKEPLQLLVKYELMNEFALLVGSDRECKITKVIEVLTCKVIQYWIECPKEKEELIRDYAFMTWIRNPKFQKHYLETKAFIEIGKQYELDHPKIAA